VELIEALIETVECVRDRRAKLYYFKRVVFSDKSDKLVLLKSRVEQTLPSAEDRVITILEGLTGGKCYFDVDEKKFQEALMNVDFQHLPWYNSRTSFRESISISYNLLTFIKVDHSGICGYIALARLLGLKSWRDVFSKLIDDNFFGHDITYDWQNKDSLPGDLWLSNDACKLLALKFNIPILILKDSDSFEHFTVVFTAIARTTTPAMIACLHLDGERYSGLEHSHEGLSRLREIYSNQLSHMEEDAGEHQVG
jgi:hypothetical protein